MNIIRLLSNPNRPCIEHLFFRKQRGVIAHLNSCISIIIIRIQVLTPGERGAETNTHRGVRGGIPRPSGKGDYRGGGGAGGKLRDGLAPGQQGTHVNSSRGADDPKA
jgi:hypothetical protein